jgi:hypothetical protein
MNRCGSFRGIAYQLRLGNAQDKTTLAAAGAHKERATRRDQAIFALHPNLGFPSDENMQLYVLP